MVPMVANGCVTQRGPRAHAGGGRGCLAARVAAADDDHIKIARPLPRSDIGGLVSDF